MKKIVEISACRQCPHKETYFPMFIEKGSPQLFRCEKSYRDLEVGWWNEIPVWCPLPTNHIDVPPKTKETEEDEQSKNGSEIIENRNPTIPEDAKI